MFTKLTYCKCVAYVGHITSINQMDLECVSECPLLGQSHYFYMYNLIGLFNWTTLSKYYMHRRETDY